MITKTNIKHRRINPRDVIANVNTGLCILDRYLRIVWINKKVKEGMSSTNNGFIGKHCYRAFFNKAHSCKGCPVIKTFKTEKSEEVIMPGFNQNDKKCYFKLTARPLKYNHNKVLEVLEIIEDVTETVNEKRKKSCAIDELEISLKHLLSDNRILQKNIDELKRRNKIITRFRDAVCRKFKESRRKLDSAKEELRSIIKINNAFILKPDLKKISNLIARLACKIMHTDACDIRLLDEKSSVLFLSGGWGLRKDYLGTASLKLGESLSAKVANNGRPIIRYDLFKSDIEAKPSKTIKNKKTVSTITVPIMLRNKILGVITTYNADSRKFSKEDIKFISVLASQAAVALQETVLYEDMHRGYFNTVHSLVLAMEARDPYTRGHADRVTRYSIEVAKEIGLPDNAIEILRYACEVHDVGKIAISDLILNKPGKLSPTERAVIESHPARGAEMLEPLQFLRSAIPLVRHHHERYDGQGYPDGLEKDNIPLMAKIMACADAFDAMTSDRPYRNTRMSTEEALVEIKDNIGGQFDPRVAKVFIKIISNI